MYADVLNFFSCFSPNNVSIVEQFSYLNLKQTFTHSITQRRKIIDQRNRGRQVKKGLQVAPFFGHGGVENGSRTDMVLKFLKFVVQNLYEKCEYEK